MAPLVSNQQNWVEYSTFENCCDPLYLWVITDRTTDFAILKRQLDVAGADITLVNKRLDEAQGMYIPLVSKC